MTRLQVNHHNHYATVPHESSATATTTTTIIMPCSCWFRGAGGRLYVYWWIAKLNR